MLNGSLQPLAALGNGATGIVFLAKTDDLRQTRPAAPLPTAASLHVHQDSASNNKSNNNLRISRPPPSPTTTVAGLFALKAFRRSREHDLLRSQNEEHVLSLLPPHPFLPRLHSSFDFADFRFLVLDFCAGGDLSSLRRCIPDRRFSPSAIRFYAAEIVLALHHLHLHGVVYRDLKPENILLSASGHVVLTDFDLSAILPPKKHSPSPPPLHSLPDLSKASPEISPPSPSSLSDFAAGCLPPLLFMPSLSSRRHSPRSTSSHRVTPASPKADLDAVGDEERPSSTQKSHSFVGTEEYVAPEIIQGTGHEFAVDWWGLGIVLYEMAYGKTPFRGATREETFHNILQGELSFPRSSTAADDQLRDLISRLLIKEPHRRLGFFSGSEEFKAHPFFSGVRWEELCDVMRPPFIPYTPASYDVAPRFDLMAHLLKVEVARSEARAKKIVRAARRHLVQPT